MAAELKRSVREGHRLPLHAGRAIVFGTRIEFWIPLANDPSGRNGCDENGVRRD
jgi:hypothetical protein